MDHIQTVVDQVTRKTGLALSPAQIAELKTYVSRRNGRTGATGFLSRLDDPAEFRLLVDFLTVRETFFYRYEAQFDAFRDRLLPQFLARARDEGRRVRLWSAGCCTGEEAYTLALIAADAGCLDAIDILATDINETYLEAAMAGVYSKRSVDKVPAPLLGQYFTTSRDGFVLDPALRARVSFRSLNLAEQSYPSLLNGTSAVDLIFCRNVLIYFEKSGLRGIIERLGQCLNPGGVLALGHSEMLPRDWPLAVRQVGDAFFYGHRAEPAPAPSPEPTPPPRPAGASPAARTPAKAIPRPAPSPAPAAPDARALLDEAERLANRGKNADAARMCRDAIRLDAALERGHYLLGLLSLERPHEAREHFRKAVYLDPAHLPARLHLAECAEKMGRIPEAVLEYRNLERLARSKPAEEIVGPLDGISYGMLALIGQRALRRLE